ncbi:1990_t:CDS:2 [Funneliformis geosporum]|uniref:8624_t:CDS:1 n=1 Tax=Funneliformis geosporum TaxID=1117311 RepID=A0A9W4SVK2_9GLOM|nr:1990_t:CDS:2 [Funneliformis geosporum]CAI2182947.1 8624_t:CDS:2 [Funneliformis geosporum]
MSEPSKVNANVNYYSGTAKEQVGNLTGSEQLKAEGKAAQEIGSSEHEAAVKASNAPSKISGNYNATVGAVKEMVGSTLGYTDLEKSGAEQRRDGNAELEAAKASDYVSGAGDKVKGMVKENVGGAVGDEKMEAQGYATRVKGEQQMKSNQ